MRTIPWAQLLCEMGTAKPFLRWTASKHGMFHEQFYHQEAALPMETEACSRGTPGQVEHRARKVIVSEHREDMLDCRPGGMRGGFMRWTCVGWADLPRRLHGRQRAPFCRESDRFLAAPSPMYHSRTVAPSVRGCVGKPRMWS